MAQSILPSKEIVIFVDNREFSSDVVFELMKNDCVVKPKQLKISDYLISDRVGIERKTYEDFIQSIIDGRLFSQLKDMDDSFDAPLLVIEGKRRSERNIHPNAIRGALSSIALDQKIPIIWTDNEEDTASLIFTIAKREQVQEDRPVQIRGKRSKMDPDELKEFIVAGLPNISTKMSKRLLFHFKTVENIFTASEEELKKVDGVGDKMASKIREILTRKYNN